MQSRFRTFLCLLSTLLLFFLFVSDSISVQDQPLAGYSVLDGLGQVQGFIDPELVSILDQHGKGDFLLHFAERPDLSPAYGLEWGERGRFVHDALRAVARSSQAEARRELDAANVAHRSFFSANILLVKGGDLAIASSLGSLQGVTAITVPRTFPIVPPIEEPFMFTPSQDFGIAWGLRDVKADQFWNEYGRGAGIVVASIDTGVQWNHPALVGSFKCPDDPADASCWYDPTGVCQSQAACDNHGHGTHVTGVMVGEDNPELQRQVGVAPGARWIACKGCEGSTCSDTALLACADWVLAPDGNPDNRPHVVNSSWGGRGGDEWYRAKVDAWRAAGIFPAFSAGNSGPGCQTLNSPADYQGVFASAAHDDQRNIAGFSSRGPSVFGDIPFTKPNLSAPGVRICSTWPGNAWNCNYSGTSMASPHGAGAVALLWGCNHGLMGHVEETMQLLQETAGLAPDGNCGAPESGVGNNTYGNGFLDVLAAGSRGCGPVGVLSGSVRDAEGNSPIAGARVSVKNFQDIAISSTVADRDGHFSMLLPSGQYRVQVGMQGYRTSEPQEVFIRDEETTVLDVLLISIPDTSISGVVRDEATGWPLYARIDIQEGPDAPIWTDPVTGQYAVVLPQGGTYVFLVNSFSSGYPQLDRVVVATGDAMVVDFPLEADLEACAAPGYLDPIYSENFESSSGGFTSSGVPEDLWQWGTPATWPDRCGVGEKCWGTNLFGDYPENADAVLISPSVDLGEVQGTLQVSWMQALEIESHEYDKAFAEVRVNEGSWTEMWRHRGPGGGQGWETKTFDLSVAAGATVQFRFRLVSDASVNYGGYYVDRVFIGHCGLPGGGLLIGHVYGGHDREPLVGAHVVTDDGGFSEARSTPDDPEVEDALYILHAPVGGQNITAMQPGYVSATRHAVVSRGGVIQQDFVLSETASILEGRVSTGEGIGLENVTITRLPGQPVTDALGRYETVLPHGWSGTVVPSREGWVFDPPIRRYTGLDDDLSGQDYTAEREVYAITGHLRYPSGVAVDNAVMSGFPGEPRTNDQGFYSALVPWGWSGTVRPRKNGLLFSPPLMVYEQVVQGVSGDDYAASLGLNIAGCIHNREGVPVAGVEMQGLPSVFSTDHSGCYEDVVPPGWSAEIRPRKIGWRFQPAYRSFVNVQQSNWEQDFYGTELLGQWSSEVGLINMSSDTLLGTLRGIAPSGELVWEQAVTLAPRGRSAFDPSTFPGGSATRYAVFHGSRPGVGYLKYFRPGEYRAGLETTHPTVEDLYIPHIPIDEGGSWWTGIALLNTRPEPATLFLEFDDGQVRDLKFSAGQQQAFLVSSLFDEGGELLAGSAIARDAHGLVGLELFGGSDSSRLAGISLHGALASELIFPHVHHDINWWTGIAIYNPHEDYSRLILHYYSKDGLKLGEQGDVSIAPGTRWTAMPGGGLDMPEETGWFLVQADKPVLGFELFGTTDGGQLAGLNVVSQPQRSGVFPKLDVDGWTGLALVNLEDSPATVILYAINDQGLLIGRHEQFLGAKAKMVGLAENFFAQSIAGATYIRFESDRDMAGFQLNGSGDRTMLDAIPILGSGNTVLYFPHIPHIDADGQDNMD